MYTDRPDYDYCRSIFQNEFKRLGYKKEEFHLDLDALRRGTVKFEHYPQSQLQAVEPTAAQQQPKSAAKEAVVVGRARRTGRRAAKGIKEESDDVDGGDVAAVVPIMSTTPQQCNEQLLAKFGLMVPMMKDSSSKISPKNLRSKKAAPKKKRRKLSWEELLATDPEQIARQRIEKEFDEQDSNLELSVKYQGKPTYAILELENKLNSTLTGGEEDASMVGMNESFLDVSPIKGYTKPMMDIVRRRHSNLIRALTESRDGAVEEEGEDNDEEESGEESEEEDEDSDMDKTLTTVQNGMAAKRSPMMETVPQQTPTTTLYSTTPRRKAGLRPHVKPTSKSLFYHKNLLKQRMKKKRLSSTEEDEEDNNDEEEVSSSEAEPEPVVVASKQRQAGKKDRNSGTKTKYEEDEDWDLGGAEPEISDGNELVEDTEVEAEEEDEDAEGGTSDSHSEEEEEESNSCDRDDLVSKRNTRLTRCNGGGGGGAGIGRRIHNLGTSNRFTESGECRGRIKCN